MKRKISIILLVLAALAASTWMLVGCGSSESTRLVPTWQLTASDAYDSQSMKDPVLSWSPDSKSLIFTAVGRKYFKSSTFLWNVGDKKLTTIGGGACPSYLDNDTFLFFRYNPISIVEKSMKTGEERTIAPRLHELDIWRDITSFSYDPSRKTIELRFSGFTRFYEPGCQEIDLTGKYLRDIPRTTGNGVLDRSLDPKGGRSAVILGDLTSPAGELRISRIGEDTKGKLVAKGDLGAVAWSPDGRLVAYSDANTVKEFATSDNKTTVVARFGELPESGDQPQICRLIWSPDSNYLAAVELVPNDTATTEMIYVLDMSKLER